jgi:hypothetical protein
MWCGIYVWYEPVGSDNTVCFVFLRLSMSFHEEVFRKLKYAAAWRARTICWAERVIVWDLTRTISGLGRRMSATADSSWSRSRKRSSSAACAACARLLRKRWRYHTWLFLFSHFCYCPEYYGFGSGRNGPVADSEFFILARLLIDDTSHPCSCSVGPQTNSFRSRIFWNVRDLTFHTDTVPLPIRSSNAQFCLTGLGLVLVLASYFRTIWVLICKQFQEINFLKSSALKKVPWV